MTPLNIIIISGPIHPHNSPRSFRSTELAIGFAKKGHNVTIYSLLGKYNYTSFEEETGVRVKSMGKSYFGNLNSDNKYLSDSMFFWVFKGLLTRIFYKIIDYPRVEYFFKIIYVLRKETYFDYLITVAHPFGLHWGAAFYKRWLNNSKFKVWTSDCGDPFMGDPDVNRKKMFLKPIEKFWCRQTDYITIPIESGKIGYYQEFSKKINIIPQGIDFSNIVLSNYVKNDIPTFLYSGAVYPGMRDPTNFLEYLCTVKTNFRFIVYAPNDNIFCNYFKQLGDKIEVRRYIPRLELIYNLSSMDFTINFKNNSEVQQPSKLIDYSLGKRPILEISTSFPDKEKIIFNEFMNGNYKNQLHIDNLDKYNIDNVCEKFLELYGRNNIEE